MNWGNPPPLLRQEVCSSKGCSEGLQLGEAGPRREESQGLLDSGHYRPAQRQLIHLCCPSASQLLCCEIFGFDSRFIRPDSSCLTSLRPYPPFRTAGLVGIFLTLSSSSCNMINEMRRDNIADVDTSEADWIKMSPIFFLLPFFPLRKLIRSVFKLKR